MKEAYSNFQFFKDVSCKTDRKLQPHYSEKGGHKERSDYWKGQRKIEKQLHNGRTPEVIIFREPPIK